MNKKKSDPDEGHTTAHPKGAPNAAVHPDSGKCLRCGEWFGKGGACAWCGVGRNRIIRTHRRRNKAGGKRGRNSGKVSQHGKR